MEQSEHATPAPVDEDPQALAHERIRVWDLPLRIFHWSLAACVLVAWLSANVFETLHRVAGYTTIALVVFRLLWGLIGSRTSRFGNVIALLRTVPHYLWKLCHGQSENYIGRSPAGAAMLVVSLTLVLISAFSGWTQITLRFFGVAWVQDLHTWSSYAVLALAALHIIGVGVASFLKKQNLLLSMIHGYKRSVPRKETEKSFTG